jgi:hypothetical protein
MLVRERFICRDEFCNVIGFGVVDLERRAIDP